MKKFLSVCVALLVFLVSAPLAQAATPYVSASAGIGFLSDSDIEEGGITTDEAIEYKTGFALNGALGIDGGMYRLEGAIGYQVHDFDSIADGFPGIDPDEADVSILSFLANGYLDIEMPASMVTPYLTAGAGVANVSFDWDGSSDDDTVFAYQFGAGVGIDATPNVMLDLGYRYFATGDVSPDDDVDVSIASHNLMAGVRVNF